MKNEKSFFKYKIKSSFHHFQRAFMEANKTISTTDVDPWNLKVKGLDIHVTKNCCITINIQKISSIHKFNLKVTRTKRPCQFLMPNQKSFSQLSAFLNLYQNAKNQFTPSVHFWDTVNFRVMWPDWPRPFLIMHTQKIFDQLLVYVNLYQHAKNQAISLICSGNMVD